MALRFILTFIMLTVGLQAKEADASGSKKYTMAVDGLQRTYLLYRPSYLKQDTSVPLIIVLHGGFGTGAQAEESYGWDKQADEHGFVVAYPDGINRSWNAGGICCGKAMKDKVDDLAFVTEVIQKSIQMENIDPKRVYLTGMSNGAALSYRYACEGSFNVAAIGPVSGSLAYACEKPRAVSVMEIHGMEDNNIPLAGGIGSKGITKVVWLPVKDTLAIFKQAAGCKDNAPHGDGAVHIYPSSCIGGREVILVTIGGAGHQWPAGRKVGLFARTLLPLDPPSDAMDATSVLWEFFKKHPTRE